MWESIGYPGNSHDAIIFQLTDLYNKILNENHLPAYCIQDSETEIYPAILGDSAFPFLPWLMKLYAFPEMPFHPRSRGTSTITRAGHKW